jgi:hypothetical protein
MAITVMGLRLRSVILLGRMVAYDS